MKVVLILLGLIPYYFALFYSVSLGVDLAKASAESIVAKIKNRKK